VNLAVAGAGVNSDLCELSTAENLLKSY